MPPSDREVEALLRDGLAHHFPDDGLVGEEFAGERIDADSLWHLDPIDGTKSFVCGLPPCGTMLAWTRCGAPVLGLVDIPATGERWSAVLPGPALYAAAQADPLRCRTSRCATVTSARLCLPAPDVFLDAETPRVRRLVEQATIARYGGDCYAYGRLALGQLDLVVETGLDDHDLLPMVPIVEAAGGAIADWSGRPLNPRSGGDVVAAATRDLLDDGLAVLGR